MVRTMARQRLVNLLVSNLHGPPGPLYLAGARVLEIFQVGVVQGNVTVSVGLSRSRAGSTSTSLVTRWRPPTWLCSPKGCRMP